MYIFHSSIWVHRYKSQRPKAETPKTQSFAQVYVSGSRSHPRFKIGLYPLPRLIFSSGSGSLGIHVLGPIFIPAAIIINDIGKAG